MVVEAGLSPRVRGNRSPSRSRTQGRGSIPARAGEPGRPSGWRFNSTVYPRACGGTVILFQVLGTNIGLSPRVRGNRGGAVRRLRYARSIPACAGEPAVTSGAARSWRVYPRVCGGTQCTDSSGNSRNGLSPRVRGNPDGKSRPVEPRRSIPACAGEPVAKQSRRAVPGSIPACAGEPSTSPPLAGFSRVYPRVCGGTGHSRRRGASYRGSIPACAGEPRSAWRE